MRRYVLLAILAGLSLWPIGKIHDQIQSGKKMAANPSELPRPFLLPESFLAAEQRLNDIPTQPPNSLVNHAEVMKTIHELAAGGPVRSVDQRTGAQHRLDQERESFLRETIQKKPNDSAAHLALARHLAGTYDYAGARVSAEISQKLAVVQNDPKALGVARAVIMALNDVDMASDPLEKRILSYDASVSKEPLPKLESPFPPPTEAEKRDEEARELQKKARLKAEYLAPGSNYVQSIPDSLVEQRIFLADEYQRTGNNEEAERRYADLLHEHGDSPFVHLNYAYHLALAKGVSSALGYLKERQAGLPNDLILKVAADTARDLSQENLPETEWLRLNLEVSHRLRLLGFNEYAGAWE